MAADGVWRHTTYRGHFPIRDSIRSVINRRMNLTQIFASSALISLHPSLDGLGQHRKNDMITTARSSLNRIVLNGDFDQCIEISRTPRTVMLRFKPPTNIFLCRFRSLPAIVSATATATGPRFFLLGLVHLKRAAIQFLVIHLGNSLVRTDRIGECHESKSAGASAVAFGRQKDILDIAEFGKRVAQSVLGRVPAQSAYKQFLSHDSTSAFPFPTLSGGFLDRGANSPRTTCAALMPRRWFPILHSDTPESVSFEDNSGVFRNVFVQQLWHARANRSRS